MKRVMKIFQILIAGVFISLLASQKNLCLEEIIAGIKHSESLIKSWRVKSYVVSYTSSGEKIEDTRIWVKKGDKIYMEQFGKKGERKVVASYDGEILRVWSNNKKAIIEIPTKQKLRGVFSREFSPYNLFELVPGETQSFSEFLSQKSENKRIKLSEMEIIEGKKCYKIEVEKFFPETKMRDISRIFICPDFGFRPLKIEGELLNRNGRIVAKGVLNYEYTRIKNIWFVSKVRKFSEMNFPEEEGYDERFRGSTRWIIEFKDIKINEEIPDSFFQIKFPPGTRVWDERTGVSYIVK